MTEQFSAARYGSRLLTVLFALACTVSYAMAQTDTDDVAATVVVAQVQQRSVQRVLPVSGTVHSRGDVRLSLPLSGQLTKVLDPGTRVEQGDVIAALDNKLALLRKQEILAQRQRMRSNLAYLRKETSRLEKLRASHSASERQFNEAENQQQLASSDVATLDAQLGQINDELRRLQLNAGFAGVIAERMLKAGEYLQAGATVIRLVDDSDLEIRFEVPAAYRQRVTIGQEVSVGSRPGEQRSARIHSILPVVDSSSQTIEVRALPIDTGTGPSELATGELVPVSIEVGDSKSGLVIPRDALVLRPQGNFVYRITPANIAEKVPVQIGEGEQGWVSVSGSLLVGDWVATRGIERLKEGQTVVREDS